MSKYFPHDYVPNYDFGAFKLFDVEERQAYQITDLSDDHVVYRHCFDGEFLTLLRIFAAGNESGVKIQSVTITDGRVLSPKAVELLSVITRRVSGKINAIIMLRCIYHTMTGDNMGLREAKNLMEFYWDNYEAMTWY
jgi:hypothetical protein